MKRSNLGDVGVLRGVATPHSLDRFPQRCLGLVGEGDRLAGQVAVGQPPTSYLTKNLLEAGRVAVIAGVEPQNLLVDVPAQVEGLNADASAVKGSLEQTPEVLDPVCVNLSTDVGLGVVDGLVVELTAESLVGLPLVGVDGCTEGHMLSDLGVESGTRTVGHDCGADAAASVQNPSDKGLVNASGPVDLADSLRLVHVLGFPADKGLVNLDRAAHLLERSGLHRQADTVKHEPRGLLRDTQRAVKLVGADPVLRAGKKPDRGEPLVEPNRAVLEDGADLDRELLPRVLDLAAPQPTGGDEVDFLAAAGRASDLAVRPPQTDQVAEANVRVREVPDGFQKGGGSLSPHDLPSIAHFVSQVYYIAGIPSSGG